jgi:hypothetical protein
MRRQIYYLIMTVLSSAMLVVSILGENIPIAIVGAAYLIDTAIEKLREGICNSINNYRPSVWTGGILKALSKHEEPKETEEQRRERILLENVENYDGTPKGQIKL